MFKLLLKMLRKFNGDFRNVFYKSDGQLTLTI